MSTSKNDDAKSIWTIHEERLVDDTRKLDLRIAHVELPDGVHFEQYVLRMPKASIVVPLDRSGARVLMLWRHRFIMDRWTWELPGGYVDPGEDPQSSALRELEEETGWTSSKISALGTFQPLAGSADFENHLFLAEDCRPTGAPPDINEAARLEWVPLNSIYERIKSGEIMGAAAQIGLMHVLTRQK